MITDTPIRSVSDTALWVAAYRALESERADALFRDPYARQLAGERGVQIMNHLRYQGYTSRYVTLRTICMDELILRVLSEGTDTVLNLAAGLDTRPYRMDLPASVRWIEADMPEMISYKQEQLAGETPRCRVERVAIDLADVSRRRRFFAEVNAAAAKVLVLTEGLLVYLLPEEVVCLADDLLSQSRFQSWLTDLAAPAALKGNPRSWDKKFQAGNARMHFAPKEGADFFLPCGWRKAEFRDFFRESWRLAGREVRLSWYVHLGKRFFPKRLKKMTAAWRCGVALLKPAAEQ